MLNEKCSCGRVRRMFRMLVLSNRSFIGRRWKTQCHFFKARYTWIATSCLPLNWLIKVPTRPWNACNLDPAEESRLKMREPENTQHLIAKTLKRRSLMLEQGRLVKLRLIRHGGFSKRRGLEPTRDMTSVFGGRT